jgi:RimJ/RimL family protein N-acetyltransferase
MLSFRHANLDDAEMIFNWANDISARLNSYNKEQISWEAHLSWFQNKIKSETSVFYIFSNNENEQVGFVRFDLNDINKGTSIISIVIDAEHRGKGLASKMVKLASEDFQMKNSFLQIVAYVFNSNKASLRGFINAGFNVKEEVIINEILSTILIKESK